MEKTVKRLCLEHAGNIRDLGGYETADGSVTAFGRLLRGGSLGRLTEAEWKRLTDYGVRTVLDLRSRSELLRQPDAVPEGVAWYHCPMQREEIDGSDLSASAERAFAGSLTQGYQNMVTENGDLLAAALKRLIQGLSEGAVLFHCTAGKDRTGVLASSVLFLCGVSEEDIIADYQVTQIYNRKETERLLEALGEEKAGRLLPYLRSEAEHMERLLERYRDLNLAAYLESYGVTEEDISSLKVRFLL